jgi:hypothetical protein
MILLGEKHDWKSCQAVLSNTNEFMGRLLSFGDNIEAVPERYFKKARENYISKPEFEPAFIRTKSQACATLCIWASASSKYRTVVQKIAPKKAKLKEVTAILEAARSELNAKLALVAEV